MTVYISVYTFSGLFQERKRKTEKNVEQERIVWDKY